MSQNESAEARDGRGDDELQTRERVLVVASSRALAREGAERVACAGGDPSIAASIEEARGLRGTFDRGLFAFELRDGSGIVLAAELLLESRIRGVTFLPP